MKLSDEVIEFIKNAGQKALATIGPDGPNLVPLSMVSVADNTIVICDCFMHKTKQNLQADPRAALSFWQGMEGFQFKGTVAYHTEGECFDDKTDWLKDRHPDRRLCGILIFTPEEMYDLAPKVVIVETE